MKKVTAILAVAFSANSFAQATANEVITITANRNTTMALTLDNSAFDEAKALESEEAIIIEQNGDESNSGDDDANSFTLYREMGTQEGDMNSESIFEQDLKKGSYKVDVNFILTEVL